MPLKEIVMGNLSEAIERLQPPLRVEAFNHIEAGKADFMAMIVRDPEPGVAEILGQQMQDQTAEDICLVVNEAADELTALREETARMRAALEAIKAHATKLRAGTDDWFEMVEFQQFVARGLGD